MHMEEEHKEMATVSQKRMIVTMYVAFIATSNSSYAVRSRPLWETSAPPFP